MIHEIALPQPTATTIATTLRARTTRYPDDKPIDYATTVIIHFQQF